MCLLPFRTLCMPSVSRKMAGISFRRLSVKVGGRKALRPGQDPAGNCMSFFRDAISFSSSAIFRFISGRLL